MSFIRWGVVVYNRTRIKMITLLVAVNTKHKFTVSVNKPKLFSINYCIIN